MKSGRGVKVVLKGVHKVRRKLADGSERVHYYAWRGGPKIEAEPGTEDFVRAWTAAREALKAQPAGTTIAAIIARYRASADFARLAPRWKQQRVRWLEEIVKEFGADDIRIFEDRRTRRDVIEWRDSMAAQPRKADIAVASLNTLLNWALDRGDIAVNVANGIAKLHECDHADEVWTADELAAVLCEAGKIDACLPAALKLAADTGLSRSDLIRLPWSAVGAHSIAARRGKTRQLCAIPILAGAREALDALPCVQVTVLTDAQGAPWKADRFSKAVRKARDKAGVAKRLHDLRGTFATRMKLAGFAVPEIADALGWAGADGEKRVSKIMRRYVDSDRIASERIARFERGSGGGK